MNLLVITKHLDLLERVRTAFEGAGHTVQHVPDALHALAIEAWEHSQLVVVDAASDVVDGFRFCNMLRGESRVLFQSLPIFLVLDHPPQEDEVTLLQEVDADGYVLSTDGLPRLLEKLRPAVEGQGLRIPAQRAPILVTGLRRDQTRRLRPFLEHFGFDPRVVPLKEAETAQRDINAPIAVIGAEGRTLRLVELLSGFRTHDCLPYTVLLGPYPREPLQRRLFLAGVSDWLPLPVSPAHLLQACRRGLHWIHAKRIQREFESRIHELHEQRTMLEIEAAALRNEVLTDPLTELLNRRAFNQNLEHAIHQYARHHRPFVLILGDLDYFKLVNDRFGHLVGDQVLRVISQRIRASLRRADLAFRIGGEEFAVILSETSLQAGAEVAEKLRRRIDGEPVLLETGQSVLPTMSFGVGAPSDGDAGALFASVDQALYRAKQKGRNCTEVVGPGRG